jgi:hypothetical protein
VSKPARTTAEQGPVDVELPAHHLFHELFVLEVQARVQRGPIDLVLELQELDQRRLGVDHHRHWKLERTGGFARRPHAAQGARGVDRVAHQLGHAHLVDLRPEPAERVAPEVPAGQLEREGALHEAPRAQERLFGRLFVELQGLTQKFDRRDRGRRVTGARRAWHEHDAHGSAREGRDRDEKSAAPLQSTKNFCQRGHGERDP